MKKQLFIFGLTTILSLSQVEDARSEGKFYFGGGYQLSNVSFEDETAQGSYTVTETIEVIDDDLTVVVDNGDGTTTTTTTTELVDIETSRVGGYLDNGDYFANIFNNFNIFAGVKVSENASVEFGFFHQEKDKTNNNSNQYIYDGKTAQSSATLQILSIDMVLNSPLIEDRADLNIIIGGSSVTFKTESDFYDNGVYSNTENQSHTDFGINIGVGIDTFINDTFSIRTAIKGTMLPASDIIKTIVTASVGLKISI